jgi:hypothetical protein
MLMRILLLVFANPTSIERSVKCERERESENNFGWMRANVHAEELQQDTVRYKSDEIRELDI